MKLDFMKVDQDLFGATREEWTKVSCAGSDHSATVVYQGFLDECGRWLAGDVITNSVTEPAWYAVKGPDETVARALLMLNHVRQPKNQLRMLQMLVAPDLDASDEQDSQADVLSYVAATAITGALGLMNADLPANNLKIWCSVPLTKDFLLTALRDSGPQSEYRIESAGNWVGLWKLNEKSPINS